MKGCLIDHTMRRKAAMESLHLMRMKRLYISPKSPLENGYKIASTGN
jgi:hypothetical protein